MQNVMQLIPNDPIATLIALAALVVSLITFAMNYQFTRRSTVLNRKPVLVFLFRKDDWLLRNVGNGPAMNVVIFQMEEKEWIKPVRIPPVAKDGEFILHWVKHNVYGLGARYCDPENLPYSSTCIKDISRTQEGHIVSVLEDSKTLRYWQLPPGSIY
jgi:hypothetical protein